jgi:hypothetical protein
LTGSSACRGICRFLTAANNPVQPLHHPLCNIFNISTWQLEAKATSRRASATAELRSQRRHQQQPQQQQQQQHEKFNQRVSVTPTDILRKNSMLEIRNGPLSQTNAGGNPRFEL